MADYTKTGEASILSHQAVTLNTSVDGTLTVTDLLSGVLQIYHGTTATTSNASGVEYYVRVTGSASGDENWSVVQTFRTVVGASNLANIAGTEAIGQTVIDVTAGEEAGFAAGQTLYIEDTGTLADSEWALCADTETDDIIIQDGLTTAKDSSDNVNNQGEIFTLHMDLSGVIRVNVVCNHRVSATGATLHCKAFMTTADAIV